MKTIASRQNPWFKRVREAIREHGEEIVIEGPKQVADAIASGWVPIAVVQRGGEENAAIPSAVIPSRRNRGAAQRGEESPALQRHARPDLAEDPSPSSAPSGLRRLGMTAVAARRLNFAPEIFDALTETKASQGVIALFQRPHASFAQLLARRDTILVALDGVQDPGNVGTIVRLAAAFDAAGVGLLPGCADAFGPKAIRASAGAILTVPVVEVTARDLVGAGLPLLAAEQTAGVARPPARGAILVFGSEGCGVSPEIRAAAKPIAIAMSPRVESLNVAMAAAVLLAQSFEARIR